MSLNETNVYRVATVFQIDTCMSRRVFVTMLVLAQGSETVTMKGAEVAVIAG